MTVLSFLSIGFLPFLVLAAIFTLAAYKESKTNQENYSMNLKKVYLYLVSLIALVIAVIGSIMLVNLFLKMLIIENGSYRYNFENDLPAPLAMIIITLPVWWFHWRAARKEQ